VTSAGDESTARYGRIERERSITAYRCAHCGRSDPADDAGNCQGCGAPKKPVARIDVTCLRDVDKQYIYIEE
jgi:ribosomal protein L37E